MWGFRRGALPCFLVLSQSAGDVAGWRHDPGRFQRRLRSIDGWRRHLDTARREELGRNALKVVRENQGAIDRTVDMIVQHLEGGEMYVPMQK